jgi:hypothetical protein
MRRTSRRRHPCERPARASGEQQQLIAARDQRRAVRGDPDAVADAFLARVEQPDRRRRRDVLRRAREGEQQDATTGSVRCGGIVERMTAVVSAMVTSAAAIHWRRSPKRSTKGAQSGFSVHGG